MRIDSLTPKVQVTLAVLFCAALVAQAQNFGAGGPSGMYPAMAKIFGDVKAFTAKAEVQVLDDAQKEKVSMPMDFEFLDGKIRVTIDMAQMKNKDMPPSAAEQLRQMGMAHVISIVRPDKNQIYVLYPDNKVMMTMPTPKEGAAGAEKDAKLSETALGKETVDGHPCEKKKLIIDDPNGQKVDVLAWRATDLKDFPIQIQTKDQGNTSMMRFKQVKFDKPDTRQFEPPEGYTKYGSPQEMMQGMMGKMMQQGEQK